MLDINLNVFVFLYSLSQYRLSIGGNSFEQAAAGAVLDLLGDHTEDLRKNKSVLKW